MWAIILLASVLLLFVFAMALMMVPTKSNYAYSIENKLTNRPLPTLKNPIKRRVTGITITLNVRNMEIDESSSRPGYIINEGPTSFKIPEEVISSIERDLEFEMYGEGGK